jgi:RluA family pseudouridine synthase
MTFEIEVIHSDPYLLVVNKPAGLLSIPDGYDPALPHIRSLLEPEYGRLFTLHRLDKETSGLLVLARDAETHRAMNTLFDTREIEKRYQCLVLGRPDWVDRNETTPLRVNADRDHRTLAGKPDVKPAKTVFHVLKLFDKASLIGAELFSGITHQIRAHIANLGHPILLDTLYTRAIYKADMLPYEAILAAAGHSKRLMLHALNLKFSHPITQEQMSFTAPLPPDFSYLLKVLNK